MAGGLGILRAPNPLTRPLPLQHQERKTESRAQLGHWREAPSGFQSPIHRPPGKKNTRKHHTEPLGRTLAPRGPQDRRPGHSLSSIFLAYSFPSSTQPPVPTPKPRSTAYPLGSSPPAEAGAPAAAAAAPARSRSLTCCCKGISETSLAPGEVGGRLERGPEGRADRRRRARAGARGGGGAGRGEGGWPCRGRVRGRRDGPEPGSRRAGGSGCPLSPPAPPPAAASSPVTGASSAHVCETSPAGPGDGDRTGRRDGNAAAPALRRRGAGRGTGRGRKG